MGTINTIISNYGLKMISIKKTIRVNNSSKNEKTSKINEYYFGINPDYTHFLLCIYYYFNKKLL